MTLASPAVTRIPATRRCTTAPCGPGAGTLSCSWTPAKGPSLALSTHSFPLVCKIIYSFSQGCGVGRFFRIPTPDSDSSSFEKPTPDSSWKHATPPTPQPCFLYNLALYMNFNVPYLIMKIIFFNFFHPSYSKHLHFHWYSYILSLQFGTLYEF